MKKIKSRMENISIKSTHKKNKQKKYHFENDSKKKSEAHK